MRRLLTALTNRGPMPWAAAAIAVSIAAVFVPTLWVTTLRDDVSMGDLALIEMRVRDMLSSDASPLGAYSRYGWDHPGAIWFAIAAVPYRLLGGTADALRMVAIGFNLVAAIAMCGVVARRGVAALVAVTGAMIALQWALAAFALADGWNVSVSVLPFMLTLVACWTTVCGDRRSYVVSAAAMTFVVQTHVGFGVVLLPAFVGATIWLAARAWHAGAGQRQARLDLGIGAGVGLLLSLPVIWNTLVEWPGNLGLLARWSLSNDEPQVGITDSLRVLGRATSLTYLRDPQFPRLLSDIDTSSIGAAPGALVVLLAVATWVARRSGLDAEFRLCMCLVVSWLAAVFAAGAITRPLGAWLVEWVHPLTWLTWAAVAMVGWRVLQRRIEHRAPARGVRFAIVTMAAVVLIAGTIAFSAQMASTQYASTEFDDAILAFTTAIDSSGELDERTMPLPVIVDGEQLFAGSVVAGVVNQLDRTGRPLCVEQTLAASYQHRRVCTGDPRADGPWLLLRTEPTAQEGPLGGELLAVSDALDRITRAEADSLTTKLAAVFESTGRAEQVPWLYTPLVASFLTTPVASDLAPFRADIERLADLRARPNQRFSLYLMNRSSNAPQSMRTPGT